MKLHQIRIRYYLSPTEFRKLASVSKSGCTIMSMSFYSYCIFLNVLGPVLDKSSWSEAHHECVISFFNRIGKILLSLLDNNSNKDSRTLLYKSQKQDFILFPYNFYT
ncbi:hypothetical protein RCL_jg12121.t1 [Rhizophagus clarus]|uniref:Uncharacterized protein n=1 Tax=Rhizophagus clarus TaxID=94130 RepID=A0A8H3QHU0_9GLOM|nr:hypothetical protein RCL_jg12121.t1 [Rhizophagus clarus]